MGIAHGDIADRHVVRDDNTGELCLIDFSLGLVRCDSNENEWQKLQADDLQRAEEVIEQWVCNK